MTRIKRLAVLAGSVLFGLAALLAAAAILVPMFIDQDALARRITEELARKEGIRLDFSHVDFHILPRPGFTVSGGTISKPGRFSGTFESIVVQPRLAALLLGRARVGKVHLTTPRVEFTLADAEPPPGNEPPPPVSLSILEIERKLPEVLASLQGTLPELKVSVTDGDLTVKSTRGPAFHLADIQGYVVLPPEAEFQLSAKSDHFRELSIQGWANPAERRGKTNVAVKGLTTRDLIPLAVPGLDTVLGETLLDLECDLGVDGSNAYTGALRLTAPVVTCAVSPTRHLPLRGVRTTGSVNWNGNSLRIDISNLSLDEPRLKLNGSVTRDMADGSVRIDLKAEDVDVAEVRQSALALAPNNRAVQRIFQIVQEGRVSSIAYRASAPSPAELGRWRNFEITGAMTEGRIVIPKTPLIIDDASGSVRIANGILEGWDLKGRTGKSPGRDGFLTVGLHGDERPFHLDIGIDADLSDLPPVLRHFVKDEHFQGELARVENLEGKATGRLILGETLNAVKTTVQTKGFTILARYDRFPTPLELAGESFTFQGRHIDIGGFRAQTAGSSLTGASIGIDWGDDPFVSLITTAPGHVALDELHHWLSSLESLKKTMQGAEGLKGTVTLDGLSLTIPFRSAHEARFHTSGTLAGISFKSPVIKDTVTLDEGRFELEGDKVTIRDVRATHLDAKFGMSGEVLHPLRNGEISDLRIDGTFGPQAMTRIADLVHLPADFRIKAPATITEGRLDVREGSGFSFAGNISVPGVSRLSLDVQNQPNQLDIKRLTVTDKDSDATLSLSVRPKQVRFSFEGTLASRTMDAILASNTLLSGSITGKLDGRIQTDNPAASTAKGHLRLTGLHHVWGRNWPAHIETATLLAKGNRVEIIDSTLRWRDGPASLTGHIEFSPSAFNVNLDLDAELLDWEWLHPEAPERGNSGSTPPAQPAPPEKPSAANGKNGVTNGQNGAPAFLIEGIPIRGTIRVRLGTLVYEGKTFSPMNANVQLGQEGLHIRLDEAVLCGIPAAGFINVSSRETRLEIKPEAKDADLAGTLLCLWKKDRMLTGTFALTGALSTHGKPDELVRNLAGTLQFSAAKGRIHRFNVLAKIFATLNITGLFTGKLPDLMNEGCPYDSMKARATVQDGVIRVDEAVMDADCAKMALTGTIDLVEKKVNMTALVSPLKTVDKIIDKVPVLRTLLDGTLVTIPVGIRGDLADPTIVPLSPTAIGSELFGFMKRTFKLPLKLVQPSK